MFNVENENQGGEAVNHDSEPTKSVGPKKSRNAGRKKAAKKASKKAAKKATARGGARARNGKGTINLNAIKVVSADKVDFVKNTGNPQYTELREIIEAKLKSDPDERVLVPVPADIKAEVFMQRLQNVFVRNPLKASKKNHVVRKRMTADRKYIGFYQEAKG